MNRYASGGQHMREQLGTFIRGFVNRLGFELIPIWRLERFQQANYMRRLFEMQRIDLVVDIGANEGQFRDFLRDEVGYAGAIVSVEPLPECVKSMRARSAADQQWLIEELALGRAKGCAQFNQMNSSQFSSFLKPSNESTVLFESMNAVSTTIDVEIDTLDALLSRHIGSRSSVYLKLDTQGFDLEVLAGGRSQLHRVRAMQSEMSVTPIYFGSPNYSESIARIEAEGFQMSSMFPNNEGHFPALVEFDCCFVRAADSSDKQSAASQALALPHALQK